MSETPACSPLLFGMVALAREAGAVILGFYDGRAEVALKADASPVTAADLAAEEVILAGLRRLAPEVPVIAEEAVARGAKPKAARQFFLVDPLDGTKEFISRNGEFTVNIALIEAGQPVAGVVYAPAIGRLFWGETGKGAAQARVAGTAAGGGRRRSSTALQRQRQGRARRSGWWPADRTATAKPTSFSPRSAIARSYRPVRR